MKQQDLKGRKITAGSHSSRHTRLFPDVNNCTQLFGEAAALKSMEDTHTLGVDEARLRKKRSQGLSLLLAAQNLEMTTRDYELILLRAEGDLSWRTFLNKLSLAWGDFLYLFHSSGCCSQATQEQRIRWHWIRVY